MILPASSGAGEYTMSTDARWWVRAAIALHLILFALAAAAHVLGVERGIASTLVLSGLVLWLIYLFLTKGPVDDGRAASRPVRLYFLGMPVLVLLAGHALLNQGYDPPDVAFRFFLLGVLLPFAIVLRMRRR